MSYSVRKIGDVPVNPIGFGAMGISAFYGAVESDEERFKILDKAYELGSRHWDTANAYGDSEILIGKWFKRTGKRSDIFVATKFGFTVQGTRADPAYAKVQCEKSLERLGIDTIDLYYVHRVDATVPIEFTIRALVELINEGKIKYIGLSECTANDLRRAHAVHPISALQVEFSPFNLHIEDPKHAILKTARELGITIVVYSPLARGLVTGLYKSPDDFEADDYRRTIPKYSKDNFPKILEVADRLKSIGATHNATAGQVTLAWIMAQGNDFVTIPGTKKIKYLEENMGGLNVHLSQEEVATIRKLAVESDIPGDRYGPGAMEMAEAESPPLPQ